MNSTEADSVLQQQSKRLAGLSITNATGTKVSILNDNSTDLDNSPVQPSTPRSPYNSSSRGYLQEEYIYSHHDQRFQSISTSQRDAENHRHKTESSFETGRSSSLTNASTPTYSSLDMETSKGSSKSLTISSQRSRSLSGGSSLSPRISSNKSSSIASSTYPFFPGSYSEDNQSDDSESCRRTSEPNADSAAGPNFVKRKYSCSFPGCNRCFTTSGHLARHNRIHTGEKNFACLMPGCPSRFSRQDNMMQHYRTHVSPKSRRGASRKLDDQSFSGSTNNSEENLLQGREQSPNSNYYGSEYEQHQHISKMGGTRQGSRQNSPPRFSPFDRSGSVEYAGRHSTDNHSNSSILRHKKSGIIQAHQHHTPMPHFNVTLAHQQEPQNGQTSYPPSPLTPTIAHLPGYHHQSSYVSHSSNKHAVDIPKLPNSNRRSETALASPTSPMTQDVERMEGMLPSLEHDRHYYQQKYYHSQSALTAHSSHASHAQPSQHHNSYRLPPLSLHVQDRKVFDRRGLNVAAPPSPQSSPHTPTKYRFDPIQDCLQQEKEQQQYRDHREHNDSHYSPNTHHSSRFHGSAVTEDEEMSPVVQSSVLSPSSSMTSISSTSSVSLPGSSIKKTQYSESQHRQESDEDMSGLAHLAQIVTTYG
ncbi:hypothetical protein BGZ49_005827 [Haplosporangium sp. Z 27]|nr:hypothetical protein BGZ49_005827 [Haplosporangium sp. Z 27]